MFFYSIWVLGVGRGGGGGFRLRSGESAPSGPPLGALMRSVQPPVRAGDPAPKVPTLGACSTTPLFVCA